MLVKKSNLTGKELESHVKSKEVELRLFMAKSNRDWLNKQLGMHPTYISGFIHGTRGFGYKKIIECCKILNI